MKCLVDKILQNFDRFFVLTLEVELKSYAVLVLCYLHLVLADGHRRVAVLNHFSGRDVDRMRGPLLQVFTDKFMIDALEDPVTHVVLFDFAFDIAVARHHWLRHVHGADLLVDILFARWNADATLN